MVTFAVVTDETTGQKYPILEISQSIQAAGVDEKKFFANLDNLAEEAFDDQCTGTNPRYPLISEIKQLYTNA